MATYKTMQKKCVLQILSSYPGRAFTVRDIEEIIRTDQSISCKPSESSVYRIINDLVSGGSVHKSVNNKREYQYTFMGSDDPKITVRCKICGKTEHIDKKVCQGIIDGLRNNSYIYTDDEIEVMGICEECK
ncbi:MAG: transcriptional repressor [Oscillospiraceae bacterium]|nr:transcriptional repressor [Oscillospiraceae bacterium]